MTKCIAKQWIWHRFSIGSSPNPTRPGSREPGQPKTKQERDHENPAHSLHPQAHYDATASDVNRLIAQLHEKLATPPSDPTWAQVGSLQHLRAQLEYMVNGEAPVEVTR